MKRRLHALAAAALSVAAGSSMAINVGGLELPDDSTFAVASIYENVVTDVGQTLSGVGEVTQINGVAVGTLCAGCELTYRFGGYEVTSISATDITFADGWINFYLGSGADNDFNPFATGSSAADFSAATNGTLFLTLAGHAIDAAGSTFAGTGRDIGTQQPVGFGAGLADVDALSISLAQAHAAGHVATPVAALAVGAAIASNLVAKAVLARTAGGAAFGRAIAVAYAGAVVAGLAVAAFIFR